MKSTRYYDRHASALSAQYDAVNPAELHGRWFAQLENKKPGFACDIGAGSGRDANWLAAQGWDVVALEPSSAMRERAQSESHPNVTWLDDSLPKLEKLRSLGHRFDLILLSAVWMHLPPEPRVRQRAFRYLSELLKPSGVLVISLRHGDSEEENLERGFHPVSPDELLEYAQSRAVALTDRFVQPDKSRAHVNWETLVFTMPDDGTGSLPLLRHIIVNDDKSSSYKLGLLRALIRIAEGAPGVVVSRTDDYVDIPLGLVGLYWLKQYKPLLLTHKIAQHPNVRQGYGFAGDDFYQLDKLSSYDLRIGARLDANRGAIVTGAIRDACRNITQMPVRYITYPGQNRSIFEFQWRSVRKGRQPVMLSPAFLQGFGLFRIPAQLWQTLGQYACWLEPAILHEWSSLTHRWGIAHYRSTDMSVFDWEEGRRDTSIALGRAQLLRAKGLKVSCVWTAVNPRSMHIDHCFPWARWLNNDLWNLLPTTAEANLSKGDKLPSAPLMANARNRVVDWWRHAYVQSPLEKQFYMEARSSLPGLVDGNAGLGDIYTAVLHQRARLKSDQQLVEWMGPLPNGF